MYFIPATGIPDHAYKTYKNDVIKNYRLLKQIFLFLTWGRTHTSILDFFLLSPQGIIVTAPTVTATLNGYLFLKNAVFRLMYNSFKKSSKAYKFLESLKADSQSLQKLYIPKLIESIASIDPESADVFSRRMKQFRPRLIMNMIDDPKDADTQKIRRSCSEYLGLDLEHLGVMYRDSLQDIALLPDCLSVYINLRHLSQVFRIADKIAA